MGGLSGFTDWIGDTIDSATSALGDAFEWVDEKLSDVWNSDLGKIAVIAAVGYFAIYVLPEMMAATTVETAVATETGILAAGSTDLTLASAGMQLGSSASAEGALMTAGEVVAGGEGVLAAETLAATGGVDLTLAGTGSTGLPATAPVPPPDTGVLTGFEKWASDNPMMAYGGMMAGGQAVSSYMQGEQMKEMEEQRLAEEQAERNRQNVWGVNYAEGGEAISAGDRLKDLNRAYFDASAPINPAVQDYALPSERQKAGVLDQVTGRANPEQYAHRPGAV